MRCFALLACALITPLQAQQQPVPKYDVAGAEKIVAKATFKIPGAKATYSDRIALSATGGTLAVETKVENKNTVLVFDLTGKEPKKVFEIAGERPILSPSGKVVGVQPYGNDLKLHDIATKKDIGTVAQGRVLFGGFTSETAVLAVKEESEGKNKAILWNTATKKESGSFDIEGKINAFFLDSAGKKLSLLKGSKGFEIQQHDLAAKKSIGQAKAVAPTGIMEYTSTPLYAEVSSDGSVFGGLAPGGYVVHDSKDGKALATIVGLGICPSGVLKGETTLKYAHEAMVKEGGVKAEDYVIYNWKTKTVAAVLTGASGKPIESIAAQSTDGKTLVILNTTGDCTVFDTSKLK